jgi:type I restriction enzyme M protein
MITKQALGNTLWGMADILRDKVEDYKAYILSLLFFKRLSDNYKWEIENGIEKFKKEYGREPNKRQLDKIIREAHDFIIPEGCFWEDVRDTEQRKKNEKLHKAVNGIADSNPLLKGVINTVRWNEPSPDGSGGKKLDPEVLTSLISYLGAVDLSNKNASVDILGDAYEYLIKRFADENKGGTTAGQFYTPQEVVDIIVRYVKPHKGSRVYDPTCGSGGFLINSSKFAKFNYGSQKDVRIFGQEMVWNTWAIARINMILHGIDGTIAPGDTLKNPKFTKETNSYEIDTFDYVMANFPFSAENWWQNGEPAKDKKGKVITKKDGSPQLKYPGKETFSDPYGRFKYGIPHFSNGDFAFIQHIVASLGEKGKAGVVCPQGVLFRGQPEKTEEEDGQNRKADDEFLIRRGLLGLVEYNGQLRKIGNIIDAIVVLPSNLFYGTTIPGAIVFFNKNKPKERKDKVLMVYAAKEGWYKEESNFNTLMPHDVLRISTMLQAWGDIKVAKEWIAAEKGRLHNIIQENLIFKIAEIEKEIADDIASMQKRLEKIQADLKKRTDEGKKPTQSLLKNFETVKSALDKLLANKQAQVEAAHEAAKRERAEIERVKTELLDMFVDPEQRKRYFTIVDMEEIEENEFNLNIPRYVDTFEPEEEIDLGKTIEEFTQFTQKENSSLASLQEVLGFLNDD